jgi:hypothetical protein
MAVYTYIFKGEKTGEKWPFLYCYLSIERHIEMKSNKYFHSSLMLLLIIIIVKSSFTSQPSLPEKKKKEVYILLNTHI